MSHRRVHPFFYFANRGCVHDTCDPGRAEEENKEEKQNQGAVLVLTSFTSHSIKPYHPPQPAHLHRSGLGFAHNITHCTEASRLWIE